MSKDDLPESMINTVRRNLEAKRRADEAMRASEKKYRELAESLPQVVFEMDTSGNVTYINENALRVFGYTENDFQLGVNVRQVIAEDNADEAVSDIKLMVDAKVEEVAREYVAVRKDGTTFPVLISARLVMEGDEVRGIRGILTDITEQKETEAAIRISEERFRGLFESSVDGIAVVGLNGRISEANAAYLEMLGYTLEEIRELDYDKLTPKKWHPMEMEIIADQVVVRGFSDEYEKEVVKADGTVIPVTVRRWLIRDENGEMEGMWSIVRDMTPSKQYEEELRRINAELDGFAHTVSHDLKGPLAAIMGANKTLQVLLQDPHVEDFRKEIIDMTEILDASIKKADGLVRDLLSLAETAQVPERVEDVDIREVVGLVLSENDESIEDRGVHVAVGGSLGTVRASPTQVYQVFSNLISNAIVHNDNEKPVVTIERVDTGRRDEHRFRVSDNGGGIPPEDASRIFEPFFRSQGAGTGIGLAIVNKIIDVYEGEITVRSEGGACFEFTLHDFPG